jgi:methyl-accepting chemotaxis protein
MDTAGLDRFSRTFEASARRWELIVYPSLFAFIVLAAYGFYLIYNLTHDVGILARSIDHNMGENMGHMSGAVLRLADSVDKLHLDVRLMVQHTGNMSRRLDQVETHMASLSGNVASMTTDINGMLAQTEEVNANLESVVSAMRVLTVNVGVISSRMEPIVANLVAMNQAIGAMTYSMHRMGRDVGGMSQAARPMNIMNSFMPWGGGGSGFMPW